MVEEGLFRTANRLLAASTVLGLSVLGATPVTLAAGFCDPALLNERPAAVRPTQELRMVLEAQAPSPDVCAALAESILLAQSGNEQVLKQLGGIFLAGTLVPVDIDRALGYYDAALAVGQDDVLLSLGDAYRAGTGVATDPATAADYFERALATGNLLAALRLGDLYLEGAGAVAADTGKAIDLYKQAASGGRA